MAEANVFESFHAIPGVPDAKAHVIFFRLAEEYDMSFRIWNAGYRVERFEDIHFGHDKVPGGRCSALTRRMDLRNNMILIERYLPRSMRNAYRHDWLRR